MPLRALAQGRLNLVEDLFLKTITPVAYTFRLPFDCSVFMRYKRMLIDTGNGE